MIHQVFHRLRCRNDVWRIGSRYYVLSPFNKTGSKLYGTCTRRYPRKFKLAP